jgi:hypothetical protein
MRATVTLDLQRSMAMVAIKGMWRLECMCIGILQLVKDRVVVVEGAEVKTSLRREMSQVLLAMMECLRSLGLQSAICAWQLLMENLFCLHHDWSTELLQRRSFTLLLYRLKLFARDGQTKTEGSSPLISFLAVSLA